MRAILLTLTLLGAAALLPAPAAADPWPYCFSAIDDMIHDGGSTYCVDPDGKCRVSESRESIFGREERCIVR